MPRPTLSALSARAHKPLISFLGKRTWPSPLAQAHPHPAAPPEYRKTFSDVLPIVQITTNPSTEHSSFRDFWEAPPRFWRPKHLELDELEIDAVQSGGATLH